VTELSGILVRKSSGLADARREFPSPTVARYALIVLFLVNLVGYLDRQIISLLVQPIKTSLGLSDGDIGLLQGAAFVVAFCLGAFIIGRLIDRQNRRNLLVVCILIWSISAAAGGLATAGWQLFVARMGVGIGEAALLPTALSMIADYYSDDRRGRATSVFVTGTYVGLGLSLAVVGAALPYIEALSRFLEVRGIIIEAWRLVMFATLPPGLLCCALLGFAQEPPRAADHKKSPGWPGLRDWADRWRVLLPHNIGFGLVQFGSYAALGWFPSILIREYGFDAGAAGIYYGPIVGLICVLSVIAAGALGDRLSGKSGVSGRLNMAVYCMPAASLGFLLIGWTSSVGLLFLGVGLVWIALAVSGFAGMSSLADLAPSRSQGQIASIYFIFTGIIGTAGGPAIVGYANDVLGQHGWKLSEVMGTSCAICGLISSGLIWASIRAIPSSVPRG
jgi:MFS family permease